ncbi:hypothetical protein RI367_006076 [Sorochytrium milnesiophthora]
MMSELDERLLRAIQRHQPGEEYEPRARDEPPDENEGLAWDKEADEDDTIQGGDDNDNGRNASSMTGPKGVLADYRHQKRLDIESKRRDYDQYLTKLHKDALSGKPDSVDDLELEDEEFLQKYRAMRLKEMTEQQQQQRQRDAGTSDRPRFGNFKEINVNQYVSAIEDERADVSVLIHLYQPFIPDCTKLNKMMTMLARRFGYAKFLRILSTEADASFDHVALPALLVYRGGDLVCNLIRVTDEMEEVGGADFELTDCEAVLLKHGALRESDRGEFERRSSVFASDDDLPI